MVINACKDTARRGRVADKHALALTRLRLAAGEEVEVGEVAPAWAP